MCRENPSNVLFLCTGNSARSVLAEGLLNHAAEGRLKAYSAGSFPTGEVHPLALEALALRGLPTTGYRSKSWDEFAGPAAPQFNFIFTVCDQAAGEACPVWPGRPITAHWGLPDPAAVQGSDEEKLKAFHETARVLDFRIRHFLSLNLNDMSPVDLRAKLAEVGRLTSDGPS